MSWQSLSAPGRLSPLNANTFIFRPSLFTRGLDCRPPGLSLKKNSGNIALFSCCLENSKKKLIVYKISHCQWTSLPDSLHIILTSKWKIRTQQWVCACVFAFRSNTNLITHHSLKFSLVFLRLYSWSKSTFPPPVPVCSQHGRTLTTVVTSVGCRSSLVDKQEQRWNPLLNLQSFKVISEINFRR